MPRGDAVVPRRKIRNNTRNTSTGRLAILAGERAARVDIASRTAPDMANPHGYRSRILSV